MTTNSSSLILIISTKADIATDYVILKLKQANCLFYRINTEDLPGLVSSSFQINEESVSPSFRWQQAISKTIQLRDIKSVWFRRHRLARIPPGGAAADEEYRLRETDWFIKGLVYSLAASQGVAWMNNPASMHLAESKLYQLTEAQALGFRLPDTLVSNDPDDVRVFFTKRGGNVVAKPLRLGYFDYGDRQTCVFTSKLKPEDVSDDDPIRVAPVIYQELVPKRCDVRVTVVGDRLFAASIESQRVLSARIDWRQSDTENLAHEVHELPELLKEQCLLYMKTLGLTYGAIDLVLRPDGEYVFLEVNPGGQWVWLEDRLGLPISEAIANWLQGLN